MRRKTKKKTVSAKMLMRRRKPLRKAVKQETAETKRTSVLAADFFMRMEL